MVFSSEIFLFAFLPIYLLFTFLLKNVKMSNIVLLILSLFFYAWGEPLYVLLMIFSAFVNYLLALGGNSNSRIAKMFAVSATVIFNIGLLCVFKYSALIIGSLNDVFNLNLGVPSIALPIGISFYTFQTMSYVFDVWRKDTAPQKNFFKLLLYISFFPQLIAGPIVKYKDIAAQLDDREITINGFSNGIRRFIIGLSKKLLISNNVGLLADMAFSANSDELSMPVAWIGAITYCLQIYFDFSGYSDMAIGLGRISGFKFNENFNYPYIAGSMKDFWRRWHISLSTWFKEYVYIPLGGNRKGKIRTGINKLVVFFLTGLWHGAQWTFVVWGLFHGLFLMLETYGVIKPEKWKFKPLKHVYTLLVVCSAFVLFRAESFAYAFEMFKAMLTGINISDASLNIIAEMLDPFLIFCVIVGIVASTPILGLVNKKSPVLSVFGYGAAFVLYILCLISVVSSQFNPFIYFRF